MDPYDNGPDPDILLLMDKWEGDLAVDNVTRRATIGDATVLTWTAVDTFSMRATRRGRISFVGSDAHESITIVNLGGRTWRHRPRSRPAAPMTASGCEGYLPASVDLGEGDDSLSYAACHRAYVALDVSAECLTIDGREVSTALAGIESFDGRSTDGLTVRGTGRAERVTASARYVLVRSGPGADRVRVFADRDCRGGGRPRRRQAHGLRRPGRILGADGVATCSVEATAPTRCLGGAGQDTAYGKQGRDLCVAEVRTAKLPDAELRIAACR